jgi:hypothetical protein
MNKQLIKDNRNSNVLKHESILNLTYSKKKESAMVRNPQNRKI